MQSKLPTIEILFNHISAFRRFNSGTCEVVEEAKFTNLALVAPSDYSVGAIVFSPHRKLSHFSSGLKGFRLIQIRTFRNNEIFWTFEFGFGSPLNLAYGELLD